MIDQNKKQQLLDFLKALNLEEPLNSSLHAFVSTYNGSNDKEFATLMMVLFEFLVSHKELKIKAGGYDKIKGVKDDYKKQLEDIVEEYNQLEVTKTLNLPVSSSVLNDKD